MINHALKANKSESRKKNVFERQEWFPAALLAFLRLRRVDNDVGGGLRKTLKIYNLNLFEAKFSNQILIRKAKLETRCACGWSHESLPRSGPQARRS